MNERVSLTLTDISSAKLPENFKAAKQAIAQCVEIDECAQWTDKAARLAAYARMAKDETLLKDAMRLQAHAVRQLGDAILLIPAARGRKRIKDGSGLNSPRRQALDAAGVSERQAKTAVRVANIPAESFEAQVEAANPPTVAALAQQGTQPRQQPSSVALINDDAIAAHGKKLIAAVVEHLAIIPTMQERVNFRREVLDAIVKEMLRLGGNGSA
jgi:hypothetical protein